MRTVFDKLIDTLAKYYDKKHKWFWMKIYKLCDSRGYKYNMSVYFDRDGKRVTNTVTAMYTIVTELTASIESGV
jgi:hypothetical protein